MKRLALAFLLLAAIPATAPAKPPKPAPPSREETRTAKPLPPVSVEDRLPDVYGEIVQRLMHRGPADTLGDGLFALAEQSFHEGRFDEATARYGEFAQRFTRNLRVTVALERALMIRDCRDFDDEPLKIYARAEELRLSGQADSAAAALTAGLARYPGARLRWHFRFAIAEIARDKGNHAAAIEQALAVADTSAGSRLAPYALRLAGDETLASGGAPEKAAGYYQALLERFPDSPLAPAVRAQVLLLRKRMQL